MHRVTDEVTLGHPGDVRALVIKLKFAAEKLGGETKRELLAHFSVVIGHDMVRVCIDADQAVDLDVGQFV